MISKYPHARPKGWIEWQPQSFTRLVLQQVLNVLDQYRQHLPLTVRQVFYRLVATCGYEKTEQGYSRLCEYLNKARRASIIPFEHIRDDGWQQGSVMAFENTSAFWRSVKSAADHYVRDKRIRQPTWLAVLVEAAGMRPQIERIASIFSVPVYSSGGFDSLTAKKALADLATHEPRPCVFLHIGDHDPSGVCIFDAMAADVEAFCSSHWIPRFERVAITPEQIARYSLPTAPPKRTDKRGAGMRETCQAEALPPDELAAIVQAEIEANTDMALYAADCEQEPTDRAELLEVISRLD